MQKLLPAPPSPLDERLWEGIDRLLDRAPRIADLRRHQLGPLAARRLRALGEDVPAELLEEERLAAVVTLTAPVVLARARAAHPGPMLLMKGPAVAARYPDPALRIFKDLDLLAEDAEGAQRDLVAAGFRPVGDPALYDGIHHLRPLAYPGLPLTVEVHAEPKWVSGLQAPPWEELVPSAAGEGGEIEGMPTLPPAQHAIVLAAHSWAHEPLRRLRDLVDVAAMAQGIDRSELDRVAAAWNIERVWRTTIGAADALFLGARPTWALRIWGRSLGQARERTVLESHLVRWLACFWGLPPRDAVRTLGSTLGSEMRPAGGETRRAKVARTAQAVRNGLRRRSEHERAWSERDERRGD